MTSYVADAAERARVREQDEAPAIRDARTLAELRAAVEPVELEQ